MPKIPMALVMARAAVIIAAIAFNTISIIFVLVKGSPPFCVLGMYQDSAPVS